ncbi:unnamed protein product [Amaranthus hypochondriacus]
MRSAGYSFAASFAPVHCFAVQIQPIFPSLIRGHSSHKGSTMVVARYPLPLFSVAPMMEWTDNHYRQLARLISKNAWLYTEMLAAETIVHQKDNLVSHILLLFKTSLDTKL